MKPTQIFILLLLQGLLVTAAETATKSEASATDGVWKPVAGVVGGVPLPQATLKAITLKITGTKYEVTVEGEAPDSGTCTLDTSASPKRMTIIGTNGPNRGKTFLAIYEMKDRDSLRICYDLSGTAFPKEFQSPKGTKHYLADYRRQKQPTAPVPERK